MIVFIKPVEACNLKCLHCYNCANSNSIDFKALGSFLSCVNREQPKSFFVLHGGEPLLADTDKTLDLVKGFPDNPWRITTNLTMPLTRGRMEIISLMDEVRTSFDIGIRFGTLHNLMMWKHNMQELVANGINVYVNICFTKQLLKKDPRKLMDMMHHLHIKTLSFERICKAGRAAEGVDFIPSYEDVDEWLCKLYQVAKDFKDVKVREFENIAFGIMKEYNYYRGKECCIATLTVNADGTIGRCPNDAQVSVYGNMKEPEKAIAAKMCAGCQRVKTECLSCNSFEDCQGGCPAAEWQGSSCPYPKKLSQLIKEDLGR
jgi:radical SAM protein with 4Fe4S-binding SPASM domain